MNPPQPFPRICHCGVRFFELLLSATLCTLAGCSSIVGSFSGRTEACEILAVGRPATGTIMRLIDTGITINDDPVVEFVLRVVPSEGDAYEGHAKALVGRLQVPQVQPGRVVPLKYDPNNRARIALDMWECSKS